MAHHRHRLTAPSTPHGGFDRWSQTYDRSVLQRTFFERVHTALMGALRPVLSDTAAPRVLDVGCGTGRLLIRLTREFPAAELHGVDASPGMVEVARRKPELTGVGLEVASAAALPYDEATYDAVVSTMSFHHWEDQAAGLRDVGRVLRPRGSLLLLDVFARGPLAPLVSRLGRRHGFGLRRDTEVENLLASAGMEPRKLLRVGPPLSPLGIMIARRGA